MAVRKHEHLSILNIFKKCVCLSRCSIIIRINSLIIQCHITLEFSARLISCFSHKQPSDPFYWIIVSEMKAGISPHLE